MHFLRQDEVHGARCCYLRAAVTVQVVKQVVKDALVIQLVIQPGISVAKLGVQWVTLPERVKVLSTEGEEVRPSKDRRFYVTVETFDPFHLVTEAGEADLY